MSVLKADILDGARKPVVDLPSKDYLRRVGVRIGLLDGTY